MNNPTAILFVLTLLSCIATNAVAQTTGLYSIAQSLVSDDRIEETECVLANPTASDDLQSLVNSLFFHVRSPAMARALMKLGGDPEAKHFGFTALELVARASTECAVYDQPEEVARCTCSLNSLLDVGAEYTLRAAVILNDVRHVQTAIQSRELKAFRSDELQDLAELAAYCGAFRVLDYLIQFEKGEHSTLDLDRVALLSASSIENLCVLRGAGVNLLNCKATENGVHGTISNISLIHAAARIAKKDSVEFLLLQGADANALTNNRLTPLTMLVLFEPFQSELAKWQERVSTIELLHRHGARLSDEIELQDLLEFSAANSHPEVHDCIRRLYGRNIRIGSE